MASVAASALGLGALCAGLVVGGRFGWQWACRSPLFGAKQISFSGTARSKGAELARLAGLHRGVNLLALDRAAVERAMAAHPWVRSAKVTRRLPTALSVEVTEYQPVAIVALGDLYLVDASGRPFKRAQAGEGLDLPLVTGLDREECVRRPGESAARVQRALEVAGAYAQSKAAQRALLSEVRVVPGGWVLVTGGGQQVRLSADERAVGTLVQQLERLARVRAEVGRRGLVAEVVHLDNRARPGWVTVQVSSPPSERPEGTR